MSRRESESRAAGCVSGLVLCLLFVIVSSGLVGTASGAEGGGKPAESYRLPRDIEWGPGLLDLGGSLRLRYEWFNNYHLKTYGTNTSDDVLGERLWLDFGYRMGKDFHAFLRLQDAHFWLSEFEADDFSPACSYEDPLDIREAFLDVKRIGETPFRVKAGRQRIAYADQRIWGPGDWSNSGKYTWDGVKLGWEGNAGNVDALYARRVIADPDKFDTDYYDFDAFGLYATIKGLPFDLDVFGIAKRDPHDTTAGESGTNGLSLNAVGARALWKPVKGGEVGGTLVHQFGDWGDDSIRAWGGVVSAGYSALQTMWEPGVKLSYTYASGDSDPKDGRHETFDTMFGAASSYYGRMNIMSWMNLHDYQCDFLVKPAPFGSVMVSYHYFQLAEARDAWYYYTEKPVRRDKTGESGTELGQEVDVVVSRKIGSQVTLEAAYCHFFAGEFAEATGKGEDADWAYLMTTLTF